jgi:hypothetical protein
MMISECDDVTVATAVATTVGGPSGAVAVASGCCDDDAVSCNVRVGIT